MLKIFPSYEPRWKKLKMADCHFTSFLCNQVDPVTQASLLTHIHPALMQTGGREAGTGESCFGGYRIHGLVQLGEESAAARGFGDGSRVSATCLAAQLQAHFEQCS